MASVHDFTVKTIMGADKSMKGYEGRVLLIVNVASECGYTPQYKGLQELHERYDARGLSVLGFPANEFGAQEPGTNDRIQRFCQERYGVTFGMFSKIVAKGDGIAPLFAHLSSSTGGDVKWNFTKFLVGKDGAILGRFEPAVEPTSAELVGAIEAALG
jgi:glutathione peroxidase